jgi:hypothetical protein
MPTAHGRLASDVENSENEEYREDNKRHYNPPEEAADHVFGFQIQGTSWTAAGFGRENVAAVTTNHNEVSGFKLNFCCVRLHGPLLYSKSDFKTITET